MPYSKGTPVPRRGTAAAPEAMPSLLHHLPGTGGLLGGGAQREAWPGWALHAWGVMGPRPRGLRADEWDGSRAAVPAFVKRGTA